MTDKFEDALRDAARGLGAGAAHSVPTYHDAWARGRRRRFIKQGALAVAGAALVVGAIGINLGGFGQPGSVDTTDVALESDAVPAEPAEVPPGPTEIPATTAPVTAVPATPTEVPLEAVDGNVEADSPEPTPTSPPPTATQTPPPAPTATAVPQAPPPSTSVPTATAIPPAPTATAEPPPPTATVEPPPPTATVEPFVYEVAPTATTVPAAASLPVNPTATATSEPQDAPDRLDDGSGPATPGIPAAPAVPTVPKIDPQAPADASIPSVTLGALKQQCTTTAATDASGEAVCEVLVPYSCVAGEQPRVGFGIFDTDGDGVLETCVPIVTTTCDTDGDLLADVACIISIVTVEPSGSEEDGSTAD